jgi:glucokinase-like ROK family protein
MDRGEKPGAIVSLREHNRLRVIATLRSRGAVSRAAIVRETGLSRTTVSSLVADLQDAGLVVEAEAPGTGIGSGAGANGRRAGRPAALLSLDSSAGAVLGLDFDKRDIRVAVCDLSHQVLAESTREIDVSRSATAAMDLAAELTEEVLAASGVPRDAVLGVGMGLPGPIDQRAGAVGSSTILPGWVGVDVSEEMSARVGLPVSVDNDANLAALGELTFGAAVGAGEVIYIKLGEGIGGGLIFGGRIHHGARGTAGEIGHIAVESTGPVCRCGNRGCLETFAGTRALLEALEHSHGPELTADDMVRLAVDGDIGCRRVIADAGQIAGRALANLCNGFNPELIVVGGSLSGAGDILLDPVREAIERHAIGSAAEAVRVVPGVLGPRAQVLGALAMVLTNVDVVLPDLLLARAEAEA